MRPATPGLYAVFPLMNYSGGSAPARELRAQLETALRVRGVQLADDAAVEQFLARHRIRWVGGVDGKVAAALRAELGVEGALLGSIDLWHPGSPPKVALTARAVSSEEAPALLWMDSVARTGDDAPGAFDLGLVMDVKDLQANVLGRLADSFARRGERKAPAVTACTSNVRFSPHAAFRSPLLDPRRQWSVAVLPFVNETARRSAGDLVSLVFERQLSVSPSFRVIEPGVVRDQLFRFRITQDQGVTLDEARVLLELLRADLILTGVVREFDDGAAESAVPRVQFTAMLLERQNNEIVWESTSASTGNDGVFFFDVGSIHTASELTCRMVRRVVEGLADPSRNTPRRALR